MNDDVAGADTGANAELARRFADLMQAIRHDGESPRQSWEQLDLIDQIRNALDRHTNHLAKPAMGWVADSFAIEGIAYESETTCILHLRHRDLGTSLALKTLAPTQRDEVTLISRLRREAQIGLNLRHSCLLETSALLRLQDGSPGLLQPWHPQSLASLSPERAVTAEEAEALIRRILLALEAMHDGGYVHCDVSPANIFLPDGDFQKAALGDFGISLHIGQTHADIGLEKAGSHEFAAPEQMDGCAAHPVQDIFALGQLARRLAGKSGHEMNDKLGRFAEACCGKDVSSRPQSSVDALRLLESL